MPETQHLLEKIRPPRVAITYDVEIGDAIEMKELPFIVGVLADLSGDRDPNNPMPPLSKRKFVEIDRINFNDILAKANPRLAFQVENVLTNDNTELNLLLTFQSMDDFGPVNVVKQIPAMNALYETRTQLKNLLNKLDGNNELDTLLTSVMSNTTDQTQLQKDLNIQPAAAGGASPSGGADASPSGGADAKPGAGATTPPKTPPKK